MRKRTRALLKQSIAVMMAFTLTFGPGAAGSLPAFGAQTETGLGAADSAAVNAADNSADADVPEEADAADFSETRKKPAEAGGENGAAADAEIAEDTAAEDTEITDDAAAAEDAEIAEDTAAESTEITDDTAAADTEITDDTAAAESTEITDDTAAADTEIADDTAAAEDTEIADDTAAAEHPEITDDTAADDAETAGGTVNEETSAAAETGPAEETSAEIKTEAETRAETETETEAETEAETAPGTAPEKTVSTEALPRQAASAAAETWTVTLDYGLKIVWAHQLGHYYIGLSSTGTPYVGSVWGENGSDSGSYNYALQSARQTFTYEVEKGKALRISGRAPFRDARIEIDGVPQAMTGWLTDDGTELSPEETYDYVPESDVTLHAQWTADVYEVTVDLGKKVVYEKDGIYYFMSFSASGLGIEEAYSIAGAEREAQRSTVCYVPEGESINYHLGYPREEIVIGGVPQRITGWMTDSGESLTGSGASGYVPSRDMVLTAKWALNETSVTSVVLNTNAKTMATHATFQLAAWPQPSNAANRRVTWSTSDPSVVQVDDNGLLTAMKPGTAVITVTTEDGGFTATCFVTVQNVAVNGLNINETEYTLSLTDKEYNGYTVKVWPQPANATNKAVKYASSDPSVATVNENTGYVKAVSYGTTVITATTVDGGYTKTCKITVGARVTGLVIIPGAVTLEPGRTHKIGAWAKPVTAANRNVTFTSGNPAVATVSSDGIVTAVKPGTADITVKTVDGGFTQICRVTVRSTAVTGVKINTEAKSIYNGKTFLLAAWPQPSYAANKAVTWTSSNTAVATVDSTGLVKGVKAGTADITVKTADGGFTKTCRITVLPQPVTGVKINTEARTITVGRTFQLAAWPQPANAANKNVIWTSSNSAVAKVNTKGLVTAVKTGSAVITVRTADGGYAASCRITVQAPAVTGVVINTASVYMYSGRTFQLAAWPQPSTAANRQVTWTSSRPAVAKVNSAGLVTGVAPGTAVITVKTADGGFTETCTVTVAGSLVNR